ncbi:hypothetical protein MRX96_050410, partial [Rhipicephalus microplus]
MRQYLRLGERRYLHQGLVLACLERTQCGLGQHGLRGQHGLQLLQRQWLSRDYGKRGGRHHAWRCQKDVGPWPQVLWNDKRWGARRSWMFSMGPGPRLRSQGQDRSMGWPQGQLDPLYLSQRALGLPQRALYQNRAVAQARNVLVQQESAVRRSSRKHARLRCRGVPDEQRTPPVLSPIAAPRCTVVASCGAGTGAGRGVALCWAARGDWDRVVAAAEGVVMFALPLDSLGRICGCFGWMSRGAPEVRGLGLAETTCATPGLDAGACCGATGRGATVAVALVVAGVDADDEGRLWLREDTALGPVIDHETETGTGAGSGDAEGGRLLAGEVRVECGEAPGRPLLAPVAGGGAAGGTVEELTSSCGEEEAETSELVVTETARATVSRAVACSACAC